MEVLYPRCAGLDRLYRHSLGYARRLGAARELDDVAQLLRVKQLEDGRARHLSLHRDPSAGGRDEDHIARL